MIEVVLFNLKLLSRYIVIIARCSKGFPIIFELINFSCEKLKKFSI